MLALPGHTSKQGTGNKPKNHLTEKPPYKSANFQSLSVMTPSLAVRARCPARTERAHIASRANLRNSGPRRLRKGRLPSQRRDTERSRFIRSGPPPGCISNENGVPLSTRLRRVSTSSCLKRRAIGPCQVLIAWVLRQCLAIMLPPCAAGYAFLPTR
jgi:hypothetical protein